MSKSTTTSTATKTKKASVSIQTNTSKSGLPSSSPSGATKRLPGSAQSQATPVTNTTSASTNGTTRPSRRLPRVSTRLSTSENVTFERKAAVPAEPYTITEKYILQKFKGRPPSLIIHLHPTYFRFDQQEGSFSYQSEMRTFIDHLKRKTIPHDLLEEFRKENVRFYDGWLIVKVVDHKSISAEMTGINGAGDDERPFSIHNYNSFITPSPYAPYPSRDQMSQSPPVKTEPDGSSTDKENVAPESKVEPQDGATKFTRTQPRSFMVALKPTNMSKHMDLTLDFIAPDPKARKAAAKSAQPPTPVGTVPPTPSVERPPPFKKQKLRIDPKDYLDYEARIINSTAPPLYLEPADDLKDAERIHKMLSDPLCNEAPPSPKSRKRTVAELAADDAHAKGQERFMLVMDVRGSGTSTNNPGGVDPQAGNVVFQPRFERFNALDNIKRELNDKKQRENEKRLQEDEIRRSQQQQHQEEERKRQQQQAQINARKEAAVLRQQQQAVQQQQAQQQQQQQQAQQQQMQMQMQQRQNQENLTAQQQHQQMANAQAAQRRSNAGQAQASAIPPNMQNQVMASSPVIRQGTPQMASSPAIPNARPMVRNGSQTGGAGSPPRPGSSLQHGHPNAANMMRQQSNQGGPSRNGTPQIQAGTPAMTQATPIMRQNTPAHTMTQASPMVTMAMGTPQMAPVNMQGQMQNGMHPNMNPQTQAAHMVAMQRRQQMAQMQQMNGGQPANQQMMQNAAQAQAQAQLERQAIMQRQAMQGTPQPQQHMSPNPAALNYTAQVRQQTMKQMSQVGSPAPTQISPQQMQQMQQMQMQAQAQAQAQAQQQAMQNQGQSQQNQGPNRMPPQAQQMYNTLAMQYFKQAITQEAHKYGGNPGMIPPQIKQQLQSKAHQQAMVMIQRRVAQSQQMGQNAMMGQQQNQMMNPNMGQMANMNPNMMTAQQQQQQFQQNAQARQIQQIQIQNAQQQLQYQNQMTQMQQQMMGQQQPR